MNKPTNYLNNLDKAIKYKDEVFNTIVFERDKKVNKLVSFEACTFKGYFVFDNIKGVNVGLHFNNCVFVEDIMINECDFSMMTFLNCKFQHKKLKLKSNKSDVLVIRDSIGGELYINGEHNEIATLKLTLKKLIIKDINQEYNQSKSKVTFKENNVDNFEIQAFSLFAKLIFTSGNYGWITLNGVFNDSILFEEELNTEYLVFESSTFNDRIDINDGTYEYINFYRSSFKGLIWLNGYDLLNNTHKELTIKNRSFHSSDFDKNVTVSLSKIGEIDLSNNEFKKLFTFNSNIDKSTLNNDDVLVRVYGTNQGNIIIKDSKIDLELGGINLGNIIFKDVITTNFYLSDFQNNGHIIFSNILNGTFFTIQDSSVGKMDFLNTDFKMFNEIVISDSNIEQVNFSDFPSKIRSYSSNPKIGYGIKDKSLSNSNLKNVYNQLKKSAKNKGDIDIANKYQSLEYKYLFRKKGLGFDKLLLFLNWISNNHGKSWFRGVLFTLLVALVCFYMYLLVLDAEVFTNVFFENYVIYISSFPKLELNQYSETQKNWDVSLVVWLSRIFISYGIYQTVAGFRKYGKS